jgi:nucleoid DNA-binding protein
MNRKELERRLARESRRSRAQAADEIDTLLHKIFTDLKRTQGPEKKPQAAKGKR